MKFSRPSGLHPYQTRENAAEFLPYLYELTRTAEPSLAVACESRKPATVRQKFQYGKQMLRIAADNGEPPFEPFGQLVTQVAISGPGTDDPANVIRITKQAMFGEIYCLMAPPMLFDLFSTIDKWIMTGHDRRPFSRNWDPPIYPAYVLALKKFVQMRQYIISESIVSEKTIVVLK